MGRVFPVPFNQTWSSDLMPSVDNTSPMPQFLLDNKGMALNCWVCSTQGACGWRGDRPRYPMPAHKASLCPLECGHGEVPQSWGVQRGLRLWVALCGEILVWGGLGAPLLRPRDGVRQGRIGPASLIPVNKGNEEKLKRDAFLDAAGSSCFLSPSLNTVFSSNEGAIQSNNETLLTSQCFKRYFPFLC